MIWNERTESNWVSNYGRWKQDLTTIPSETKIIVPVENIDQEVQLTNLIEKYSGGWKCMVSIKLQNMHQS